MAKVMTIDECPYRPELSHPNRDTLIWLGAGFSRCVTKGRAPLMCGFFSGLRPEKYSHLWQYLGARCVPLEHGNIEQTLLAVEQMQDCPLPPRLRHSILAGQNPDKLREELEVFCIERLTFPSIDYSHWAVHLLALANERTTVITTNYDTLAERILSKRAAATHCGPDATCHHCNMRAILAEDCNCELGAPLPVVGGGNAPLLKLHGSIAWHTCCNTGCSIQDCLVAPCNCSPRVSPKCDCCGEGCKPVIVLPSMKKAFSRYKQIGRMWERAHAALSQCATITIFGFSFPESDCLICDVFRDALKQSRTLREVIIIDIDPEAVSKRVLGLLPHRSDIAVICCNSPPDYSIPPWIESEAAVA